MAKYYVPRTGNVHKITGCGKNALKKKLKHQLVLLYFSRYRHTHTHRQKQFGDHTISSTARRRYQHHYASGRIRTYMCKHINIELFLS